MWFERSWEGLVELSGRSEVGERRASKSDRTAASGKREVRGGVSLLTGLLDMDKVDRQATVSVLRVPRCCDHTPTR